MDTRIESLKKSLERNFHRFKETFIDEDTGKEEEVEREEVIAFDTTEEERELMESIIADVANLSDEDLETFRANTIWFWPRHYDEFYLELTRRGYEDQAVFIENPTSNMKKSGTMWMTQAKSPRKTSATHSQAMPKHLMVWKSSSTTSASNLALLVMNWDSTCRNRY